MLMRFPSTRFINFPLRYQDLSRFMSTPTRSLHFHKLWLLIRRLLSYKACLCLSMTSFRTSTSLSQDYWTSWSFMLSCLQFFLGSLDTGLSQDFQTFWISTLSCLQFNHSMFIGHWFRSSSKLQTEIPLPLVPTYFRCSMKIIPNQLNVCFWSRALSTPSSFSV